MMLVLSTFEQYVSATFHCNVSEVGNLDSDEFCGKMLTIFARYLHIKYSYNFATAIIQHHNRNKKYISESTFSYFLLAFSTSLIVLQEWYVRRMTVGSECDITDGLSHLIKFRSNLTAGFRLRSYTYFELVNRAWNAASIARIRTTVAGDPQVLQHHGSHVGLLSGRIVAARIQGSEEGLVTSTGGAGFPKRSSGRCLDHCQSLFYACLRIKSFEPMLYAASSALPTSPFDPDMLSPKWGNNQVPFTYLEEPRCDRVFDWWSETVRH